MSPFLLALVSVAVLLPTIIVVTRVAKWVEDEARNESRSFAVACALMLAGVIFGVIFGVIVTNRDIIGWFMYPSCIHVWLPLVVGCYYVWAWIQIRKAMRGYAKTYRARDVVVAYAAWVFVTLEFCASLVWLIVY
jgi:hypothetical protein